MSLPSDPQKPVELQSSHVEGVPVPFANTADFASIEGQKDDGLGQVTWTKEEENKALRSLDWSLVSL